MKRGKIMKVYILYIDCQLQGVYASKKAALKLRKKKLKEKGYFKEDNWIDTHDVIEGR